MHVIKPTTVTSSCAPHRESLSRDPPNEVGYQFVAAMRVARPVSIFLGLGSAARFSSVRTSESCFSVQRGRCEKSRSLKSPTDRPRRTRHESVYEDPRKASEKRTRACSGTCEQETNHLLQHVFETEVCVTELLYFSRALSAEQLRLHRGNPCSHHQR